VGQRVARLLASEGAQVRVASRDLERAQAVCEAIGKHVDPTLLTPHSTGNTILTAQVITDCHIVIAAGAAGVELLSTELRQMANSLRVAIERDGVLCYGAIGVGGTKMKIHKAAIRQLFSANDLVLDAPEIYALGKELGA
jgi:NAD(P)-dependent dehydrogenase (short-subunit alcohol dehydrogenase family)